MLLYRVISIWDALLRVILLDIKLFLLFVVYLPGQTCYLCTSLFSSLLSFSIICAPASLRPAFQFDFASAAFI